MRDLSQTKRRVIQVSPLPHLFWGDGGSDARRRRHKLSRLSRAMDDGMTGRQTDDRRVVVVWSVHHQARGYFTYFPV
jgi:hypothetical protein